MITFLHNFNNVLCFIWFIGGILLLPFNSGTLGVLVGGIIFKIEQDRWWRICRPIWALQMVWNLIFFSVSLSCIHTEKAGEAKKISYTLTEEILPSDYSDDPEFTKKWNWHFYRQTDEGQVEIDDHSDDATPFQKAYWDNSFSAEGLDPLGLHVPMRWEQKIFWVGKWVADDNRNHVLRHKFHALPYEEATAYIDRVNTAQDFGKDIFLSLFLSIICPFLPMLAELFGPLLLVTCLFILGKNKLISIVKSIGKSIGK